MLFRVVRRQSVDGGHEQQRQPALHLRDQSQRRYRAAAPLADRAVHRDAGDLAAEPGALAVPASPALVPYNQDNNHLYVSLDPTTAFMIDSQRKQGRAPGWSPEGQYLAFESNRSGTGSALYVARIDQNSAAIQIRQLTNPEQVFNAQHAKFSPDGKTNLLPRSTEEGAPISVGTMPFTAF
jgi:hypothetical protein